jgi:two-component system OmpR family response regulator
MRILFVEDEPSVADFVVRGLKAERFVVDWTAQAEQALSLVRTNSYDAAIIDIELAGQHIGLKICKAIREKEKVFPIIVLSATHDTAVKIEALNLGADDYLTKPFSLMELLARVRALLRREKKVIGPVFRVDDLEMDVNSHSVKRGRQDVRLNRKEFALLEYFMRNPGTLLTRAMILEKIWDASLDPFTNTVDVHVRFLRKKIDDGRRKKLIKTVHGYGYKIEG